MTKKLGTVICALLALGIIFTLAGLALGAELSMYWDEKGIHSGRGEEKPADIREADLEPFRNISVDMVSHNIEFIISDHYGFEVVNNYNTKVEWSLQNGKLTIKEKANGFLNLNFDLSFLRKGSKGGHVKIYIPAGASLENIFVSTVSGKVNVSDLSCASLNIEVVSGAINVKNVTANTLKTEGVSGSLTMSGCSAQSLSVEVVSGRVSISGLKSEELFLESVSGSVEVSGELSGKNRIESVSGSIRLQISGKNEDYDKRFGLISGSLRIDGQSYGKNYSEQRGASNSLTVETVSGSITVNFTK
ncbi:MAG: DUF4097 domain-containing protein [Clostridiales bacterium]|nr:DUF4097 domain-containing protein [Clostridiales bacterium]